MSPGTYGNFLNPKGPRMNANKFYVALLGAVAAAGPLVKDGNVSWEDAVAIVTTFLTALGVYAVSNSPKPTS